MLKMVQMPTEYVIVVNCHLYEQLGLKGIMEDDLWDVDVMGLEGKVAIVTGGASGIGACTVHLFWENGAKVVIADIQDNLGQAISDKLGQNVIYIHCDVSNEEHIINLIDTTITKFGHLDIMHNNAGIIDRAFGGILEAKKQELDRILNVNLVGAFLGAKHAARAMIPQRKGCILFTASACASIAGIATHAYAVSKYGILGLTKNLAAELGQWGIRVNCVSPSGVKTGMATALISSSISSTSEAKKLIAAGELVEKMSNLKGKVLSCEDVAKAVLFLASEEASYVSGLNLVVDGGISVVNPSVSEALSLIQ